MTRQLAPEEAMEFATRFFEISERETANLAKREQLRAQLQAVNKDLKANAKERESFVGEFQPGRHPLFEQEAEHNGPGNSERVPAPAAPTAGNEPPIKVGSSFRGRWDARRRVNGGVSIVLGTLKAKNKQAAHSAALKRWPKIMASEIFVTRVTADQKRREAKHVEGQSELGRQLDAKGARAQARVESQPPDPLPTRPRGRKARNA